MFAVTTNPIDLVFCALTMLMVTIPVCVHLMRTSREHKRMDWSPTRAYLTALREGYSQYYR